MIQYLQYHSQYLEGSDRLGGLRLPSSFACQEDFRLLKSCAKCSQFSLDSHYSEPILDSGVLVLKEQAPETRQNHCRYPGLILYENPLFGLKSC
jgi:hypothetical protein